MTDTERIIDKVQKLHAHAESAKAMGNEAEAQAFAAKVQELLTAYKLSMNDVHASGGRDAKEREVNINWFGFDGIPLVGAKHQRVAWTESLAGLVGRAYYCKMVVSHRSNRLAFVGELGDRQVAEFMTLTLARFLAKLAEFEYGKFYRQCQAEGHVEYARGFKASFMAGFISRLGERFDEEIRAKTTTESTAIVLLRKDALAKAQQWMDESKAFKPSRGTYLRDGSPEGYREGRRAANDVNLRPNPVGGGRPKGELR